MSDSVRYHYQVPIFSKSANQPARLRTDRTVRDLASEPPELAAFEGETTGRMACRDCGFDGSERPRTRSPRLSNRIAYGSENVRGAIRPLRFRTDHILSRDVGASNLCGLWDQTQNSRRMPASLEGRGI
jgi:hypothetical protein